MPDSWPHPELEVTTPVLVAEAAHRRLAADPPLQSYFTGGIVEAELEDVLLLQDVTGPTLATLLEYEDEDRDGANQQGRLDVSLRHVMIERVATSATDTRRHLRSRAVGRIKRVLLQPTEHDPGGAGVLTDDQGLPITDELTRFLRVAQPRYFSAQGLLLTGVQTLWKLTIDIVTREYR